MKEFSGRNVTIMSCLANDCYNKGKSLVMKRI